MKIGFVVQRYGTEILGGSEYHCRLVAERLADRHQVEVLTTCAREYTTWTNEYPEGPDRIRGVTVRRFATSRTRDLDEFNRFSDWIFHHRHSAEDEMRWLEQQGPWSPGLIDYLEQHHEQYDVLIFFTYLYAPTVLGIKVAPSKSLLVPTAHDEPALGLDLYQDVFGSAAAIAWNTDVERRMVSSRFHLRTIVEDVVGCGVDLPEGEESLTGATAEAAREGREPLPPHLEGPANAFRRRHRMYGPFVLYGGRIDPGKGCEELLEYFKAYVEEVGGDVSLMLMGVKLMPLPEDPRVRFAGVLSDEERLHALEAATIVAVPSPYESLSLLALEAFAAATPVLANARAAVLVDHCRRSNAGLYYADKWEFVEALRLLLKDERLRGALGQNGKAYIHRHYRWSSILTKYERIFNRLRAPVTVRPAAGPRPPASRRPAARRAAGGRPAARPQPAEQARAKAERRQRPRRRRR